VLLLNGLVVAKAVVAQIAVSKLCLKIEDKFQKENKPRKAFDCYIVDLLKKMEIQHILRPK